MSSMHKMLIHVSIVNVSWKLCICKMLCCLMVCITMHLSFTFVYTHHFFSVSGESKHYGTPTNPGAPDRVPGGSCSGAAVSVAANIVDFSLGEQHKIFLI